MNFLRKAICFTKFPTFMNLFGHWAKTVQNFVLLCSAGPSKKATFVSRGNLWRKTKCWEEGVFHKCLGIMIGKVCTFEKKLSWFWKLYSTCSEERSCRKLLYQKTLLFRKKLSVFERKIFGLLPKLFPARLSSFHSTSAEEGFREKFLEKKPFFIVSRLGAINRLLKKHQDEYQNFILRVYGRAFKTAFFLPEELCDAEQFFPSERDNYKKILISDRELFGFLAKKVSRDSRI